MAQVLLHRDRYRIGISPNLRYFQEDDFMR